MCEYQLSLSKFLAKAIQRHEVSLWHLKKISNRVESLPKEKRKYICPLIQEGVKKNQEGKRTYEMSITKRKRVSFTGNMQSRSLVSTCNKELLYVTRKKFSLFFIFFVL